MGRVSRHVTKGKPMQTLLATAATLALVGAALAQEDGYQPEAPATVEETFTRMDTDASGGVDQAEFTAYAGEGSETQFAAIAGEDGTITLDELTTYMDELSAPSEG